MNGITESILEETALAWFAELGYQTLHGADLAPDAIRPEREDYRQTILAGCLRQALERINPGVSAEGIDDAMRRILNTPSPDLMTNNEFLVVNQFSVAAESQLPYPRRRGEFHQREIPVGGIDSGRLRAEAIPRLRAELRRVRG